MRTWCLILAAAACLIQSQPASSQTESGPVKIKIRHFVFTAENEYSVNIPDLEFHVLLQKEFEKITSTIIADYDYSRKDMGFGMSHAFNMFVVNPGITVEDHLYFRKVFNDSTGIWSRKQSLTPFLVHTLSDRSTLGLNFKFEREWSPKRREGADIVQYYDNSIQLFLVFQNRPNDHIRGTYLTVSVERSYRLLSGEYNYLLGDLILQHNIPLNKYIQYKGIVSARGNLTPQGSPLFFLGGNASLLGYEKDEFWGRRTAAVQNLFSITPWPDYRLTVWDMPFRSLSLLLEADFGWVGGSVDIPDFKPQTNDLKAGLGFGFGFNTDLPYMPGVDLHFIVAGPADRFSDTKYYAGFGGWLY